jgi:hypothetical protein
VRRGLAHDRRLAENSGSLPLTRPMKVTWEQQEWDILSHLIQSTGGGRWLVGNRRGENHLWGDMKQPSMGLASDVEGDVRLRFSSDAPLERLKRRGTTHRWVDSRKDQHCRADLSMSAVGDGDIPVGADSARWPFGLIR